MRFLLAGVLLAVGCFLMAATVVETESRKAVFNSYTRGAKAVGACLAVAACSLAARRSGCRRCDCRKCGEPKDMMSCERGYFCSRCEPPTWEPRVVRADD